MFSDKVKPFLRVERGKFNVAAAGDEQASKCIEQFMPKEGRIMETTKLKSIANILALFLLISACSHAVFPSGPIPVKMDTAGPIETTKEISFVNRQTESKLTLIGTFGAHKYFADFKQWTDSVVDQVESELRRRGVQVTPSGGDYTFYVWVDNATLLGGTWKFRCIVNVRIEKDDGTWSKTFEGNNAAAVLGAAVNGAVYRAVEAILKDGDFRNAISYLELRRNNKEWILSVIIHEKGLH